MTAVCNADLAVVFPEVEGELDEEMEEDDDDEDNNEEDEEEEDEDGVASGTEGEEGEESVAATKKVYNVTCNLRDAR